MFRYLVVVERKIQQQASYKLQQLTTTTRTRCSADAHVQGVVKCDVFMSSWTKEGGGEGGGRAVEMVQDGD